MVRIADFNNIFMLLLLVPLFAIGISNAYPHLAPINGIEWDNVTGSNEAYRDLATGLEWITFKMEISPGDWNSSIENDINEMITFKWKSDKEIGKRSSFRSIKFNKDGITKELSHHPDIKNNTWDLEGPFEYNTEKNYMLNFIFNNFGSTVLIAFPPQAVQISSVSIQNRPPSRPKFNISSDVNLLVGEKLWISANATDPDNDNIDIIWDWGDGASNESLGISLGDNVTQNHYWKGVGEYKIIIIARDSMANNSSMINLNVSYPLQPINASRPEQPTEPKFNVSSDGFLWLGYDLFISASSRDLNNNSINYSWDWGDRTPDGMSPLVPSGNDAHQSHSYKDPGNYTITITASTQNGNNSSMINLAVCTCLAPDHSILNLPQNVFRPEKLNNMSIILFY